MMNLINNNLYDDIRSILNLSRKKAVKAVNSSMVEAYWNIGRLIVEFQGGKDSAEYGTSLLEDLSNKLTKDYGAGFDKTNLRRMRKFYLIYENRDTLCHELSWSHYRALLKIENAQAREFYVDECIKSGWSVRELSRQINSFYFERLLASKDKKSVIDNMLSTNVDLSPQEVIKDPYILEFLGINQFEKLYEKDLEKQLINHLQQFLLELGRGFSFVGRQKRFHVDDQDYFIDLVFYNYILKCFVLIDLKVGALKHQDIGQMQMYVNYYTREMMNEGDNLPIGIVLCADKSDAVVKYTLPEDNKQIFASKYMLYIPTEEEFIKEIQREREVIQLEKDLST
ncbi:MAG: PDDEXK nuclease domain-containing protein [Acidaminobacteraceae bacterium]